MKEPKFFINDTAIYGERDYHRVKIIAIYELRAQSDLVEGFVAPKFQYLVNFGDDSKDQILEEEVLHKFDTIRWVNYEQTFYN